MWSENIQVPQNFKLFCVVKMDRPINWNGLRKTCSTLLDFRRLEQSAKPNKLIGPVNNSQSPNSSSTGRNMLLMATISIQVS